MTFEFPTSLLLHISFAIYHTTSSLIYMRRFYYSRKWNRCVWLWDKINQLQRN